MIDDQGFRLNVGIVLLSQDDHVFWGRRVGQDAWQFPQGGLHEGEKPIATLYRELKEEVGLEKEDVTLIGQSQDWLTYQLPKHLIRHYQKPLCIGQRQKWFLLRLNSSEQKIRLDLSSSPEFDSWRWVKYWYPLRDVIFFKRAVYQKVLTDFQRHVNQDSIALQEEPEFA